MGVPFIFQDTNAWDRLEIDEFVFEETEVTIDGDFGNDWDVKKSPGADGAPATNKGYVPCKPKVTWLIYLFDHWQTYEELLNKVQPKPGKTPPPIVTVVHPQLQLVKKSQFRIEKIHTLKHKGKQILEAQFELLEYFATPKPAPAPVVAKVEVPRERERAIYDIDFQKPSNNAKP